MTLRRSAPLDALARDLDAYRAAGLEDLVVGLPRGGSADDAARALEDVLTLALQYTMTERATSPFSIASNASFTSSSLMRRETSSSIFRRPRM